jgi:hypothetical protein
MTAVPLPTLQVALAACLFVVPHPGGVHSGEVSMVCVLLSTVSSLSLSQLLISVPSNASPSYPSLLGSFSRSILLQLAFSCEIYLILILLRALIVAGMIFRANTVSIYIRSTAYYFLEFTLLNG